MKRNAKGSSVTINFYSHQGEETYVKDNVKAKQCSKFLQTCFAAWQHVQINSSP